MRATEEKIRILFVHYGEDWIRGSERVLLDLLAGLDKRRFHPVLWCNAASMAAEARSLGIQTHTSAMIYFLDYASPSFSLRRFMGLMSEARRILRQESISCVHANGAAPCQWLAPVVRSMGVPMLVHLHASYFPRSRYICLLHLAQQMIGVSHHTLRDLHDDGVAKGRTQVIPNGIDQTRMVSGNQHGFRQELGIPAKAFVILSVGSLIRRKGHDRLIKALHRLDPGLQAHLVVIGEGEYRPALEDDIARLGLADRVHLLGARSALEGSYADANCFALASHNEAWGLVFAEAGYCGLPSVGIRVGGIPEVVEDGRTGLLVEGHDEETIIAALTERLGLLATNAALCARLGHAARAKATHEFDGSHMINAFAAVYERMTASSSTASGWRGIGWRPYLRMPRRGRPSLGF
jgi:glycosyltransferase involved in cell wall biosynthesis